MKLTTKLLACVAAVALLSPIETKAQGNTQSDALEQINSIKLDNRYIWAEGTSTKNKKDALENAQAVLKFEIQNWLNQSGQKDLNAVAMPSNDQYMKIETERRKVHRAFIYVEKSQIIPIGKNEKIVVVERQEPKPKKESKAAEELVSTVEDIYAPTKFEQEMLAVKRSSDMETFINRNRISKTGKYRDRPQQGSYYIFIFNRDGDVPACLKVVNGKITNVATGKTDGFEKYKGCGGQWFIPNN